MKLTRTASLVRRQKDSIVHCEIELCPAPGASGRYLVNLRQGRMGEDAAPDSIPLALGILATYDDRDASRGNSVRTAGRMAWYAVPLQGVVALLLIRKLDNNVPVLAMLALYWLSVRVRRMLWIPFIVAMVLIWAMLAPR